MPPKAPKPNLLVIIDDSSFDLRINSGIATHIKVFTQILCFSSAEEGLDFLVENLDNPQIYPHLILLDIQMPEMDGFEFMKRYDKFPDNFKKGSNVVMLSSTDDLQDITRVDSNKNVFRLLKKPLQIEQLKAIAEELYLLD
ncbi:response regulator [Niabella ginsengisoli]|uniref:Response regulator n=1 Tax=Niabella ginsengisoli TaxID=522298 RepID=A0ABS9SP52_9BACT|nr:response regulator [Niabella ginsengisoli]MCH5600164.1 response regulator [Niabella ginsengisoli]